MESELIMSPLKSSRNDLSSSAFRLPPSQKGMALVIVLAMLVLLTGLVVAFFSSVTSDAGSSAVYSNDARAKQLADSAVNLVMGQIVEATKGFKAGSTSDGNRLAWASQPGAVRTFDTSGSAYQTFKLYSAASLVESGTPNFATDVPASWATDTAHFTDLNAPMKDERDVDVYPIVDPTAVGSVQGFSISGAPTTGTTNTAPMPARWIYVLKDGTLAASSGTGTTATVATATAANPIVGRIAFWTDDETSKININTACGAPWDFNTNSGYNITQTLRVGVPGEGAYVVPMPANYWDTPVVASPQDKNLAFSQPSAGEYQRYPGHPGTVSYAAVFKNGLTQNNMYDITSILPRYTGTSATLGSFWGRRITTSSTTVPATRNRLYASVDEFLFAPTTTGTDRTINPPTTSGYKLSQTDVRKAAFFITASSRAPDVTLFNSPRLLFWPINSNVAGRSPFDTVIAFCGTVGGFPYYFQRSNPDSPTADYNLSRNQQLLTYFRDLTDKAVPGFGGSSGILGKYGADAEQITTEIFDYIRCINLQDTSQGVVPANYFSADGLVMPTDGASGTRGFGRMPVVTKAGMVFSQNATTVNGTLTGTANAQLVLETFIPGHGFPQVNLGSNYTIEVSGLSPFQWGTAGNMTSVFAANTGNYTGNVNKTNPSIGGRRSIESFSSYPALAPDRPAFSANSTMDFTGGILTITAQYKGATVQVINNVELPSVTGLPTPTGNSTLTWPRPITATDVVRSVQISFGDYRISAAKASFDGGTSGPAATRFIKHPNYDSLEAANRHKAHAFLQDLSNGMQFYPGANMIKAAYYSANTTLADASGQNWPNGDLIQNDLGGRSDFDNGWGVFGDAPYINFPDEGVTSNATSSGNQPYFTMNNPLVTLGPGFFSPNRLVPSAGIMGSLPTGVLAGTPWQTLLFRPAALTAAGHAGLANPPDYLLLDFFNMPVVEPYAISEPLSTAGRINMNYQIAPFSYIKRTTAVEAALHTERLTAIKNNICIFTDRRKHWDSFSAAVGMGTTTTSTADVNMTRFPLNLSTSGGTLEGFENRFAANNLFRSAAEICSIPLVPLTTVGNPTYSTMANWWTGYTFTGENSKERPYARIYPKLTTKSNSYTVHYRVQVLKKNPSTAANQWDEGKDTVLSESRGSSLIERYIDPNDPRLPDFATTSGANIDDYYRFRVVQARKFAP